MLYIHCTLTHLILKASQGKHGTVSSFQAWKQMIRMKSELTEFIQTLSGGKRTNSNPGILVDPDTLLRTY